MIAKLASPLGSPTLAATTAQLRNRLPAQFRRCLPIYLALVVFVLLVFNVNLFRPRAHPTPVVIPPPAQQPDHPVAAPARPVQAVPKVVRDEFPKKIWQSWKVNPLEFEKRDYDTAKTWTTKNPDWRYEVLTDSNAEQYVDFHFGPDGFNRTDIVDFYKSVTATIVKADLLRYMIMYAEGGLYADIDVEDLKPLSKFIPSRFKHKDIDMVIGVEIDEPDWIKHPILGSKCQSFCQWTFMCKPQLPVMMRLIEQIMTWLNGVAKEQKVPLSKVKLDFDQIISGTGPSAFTEAIITEMKASPHKPKEKITWNTFHDLDESKIVSRVLVLTVEAFAAGQGHSDSGNHNARAALVKHHYHASGWPNRHPRYMHPAYGEVESCNWHDDCINEWDKNVAEFKKLPKEKQDEIIVIKTKEREEEEARKKKEKEEKARKKKEDDERKKKKAAEEKAAKEAKAKEEKEKAEREKAEQAAREKAEKEEAKEQEAHNAAEKSAAAGETKRES